MSKSWHPVLEQQRRRHTQVQGGCVGGCRGATGDGQICRLSLQAACTRMLTQLLASPKIQA